MINTETTRNSIISTEITEEYLKHIKDLKYLINKEYFLDPKTSPRIPNGILNILPFIEEDGYNYYITKDGWYMDITLPNNKHKIIRSQDYGLNHNPIISEVCENKHITTELLLKNNIKATQDYLLPKLGSGSDIGDIISLILSSAQKIGYPIIIKPTNGSKGKNIYKFFTEEQAKSFLEDLYQSGSKVHYLMQNFVEGKDYRILYYKGSVRIAYERIAPYVVGDGLSSLQKLIESTVAYWVDSEQVINYIKLQGVALDTIISTNDTIQILPNANVSTGASTRIMTEELTKRDIAFLNHIAHSIGADYFGVDIISDGEIADGLVLEINHKPGVSGVSGAPKTLGVNHEIGAKVRKAIKTSEGILD